MRATTSPLPYVAHFAANGDEMLASAREHGLEHISNSRCALSLGAGRAAQDQDATRQGVVIGAWTSSKGKFSSLMVGVHRSHLAYASNVGTGYGTETVSRIMPALRQLRQQSRSAAKNRRRADQTSIG